MKRINRAILRGEKLDDNCKNANTTINEYGPQDNRLFCYGLVDCSTESYLEKCINCEAFVDNAKPLGVE
jgi:hypothetical protein